VISEKEKRKKEKGRKIIGKRYCWHEDLRFFAIGKDTD
jgi:hypothetical protein